MKILFATPLYPPEIGGPATYAKLLEEYLPMKGVSITILPFSIVRHLPSGVRHIAFFFKVMRASFSSDVLFAQDVFSVGFPTMLASLVTRKPFFVRVPGDFAWEQARVQYGVTDSIEVFQTKHKYPFKIRLYRFVQRMVVRRARIVMTPSNYFSRIVAKWGGMKPVTVYNGLDILLIRSCIVDKKIQKNFSIIAAGRMVPWKGFKELIAVVSMNPTWTLSLVGEGPEREFLERYTKERGVQDRVSFFDKLPQQTLWQTMALHDVFVLNSSFESFSYQVVEAMALGMPIVAPEGSNLREIITNEQEGLLVPFGDESALLNALTRLEKDSDLRTILSENAKRKSETFSIGHTIERLCALLVHGKKEKDHIVFVGTDRSVFDETTRAHKRIISYSAFAKRITVVVPTLKKDGFRRCVDGAVMFIPTQSRSRWLYPFHIASILLRVVKKNTIVSPQDPGVIGLISYMISVVCGARLYAQLHTDMFSQWYTKGSFKKVIEQKIARFVLAHADKIRVVSSRIAKSIFWVSAPVSIVPIVQKIVFHESTPLDKRESPVFLVVARLEKEKNIEAVISVFSKLFHEYKKGTLIIAGEGSLRSSLEKLIARNGLEERVFLKGTVDPFPLYKIADLFVQNSFYEGFGMALIEALQSGCPALSTRVGVAEEVIVDGKNSMLCPVGDDLALFQGMRIAYEKPERIAEMKIELLNTVIDSSYTDETEYIRNLGIFYGQ